MGRGAGRLRKQARTAIDLPSAEVKTFPSMSARPTARRLLGLSGWAAVWTLVGLAIASEIYLSSNFLGRSITWGEAISDSLEDWYVYGLLAIPVTWMARTFPPERGTRWMTTLRKLPITEPTSPSPISQSGSGIDGHSISYPRHWRATARARPPRSHSGATSQDSAT